MAKNLKVSDDDKKEIERLFKDGLDAALKNPKKFWDAQRERESKMKPYSKLSAKPLVLPKGTKRENVTEQMNNLLADLGKGK